MKIRSAAAVASAALIALALPAVAIAGPSTGSLDSPSASPVVETADADGPFSGDASTVCKVDWTSIGFLPNDADQPTLVSPAFDSPGYLRTDSFVSRDGMTWRSVAATDEVIKDFSLQVTLPAGVTFEKSGVTIEAADSTLFAKLMGNTTRWATGLGPDDLDVSEPVINSDGTTTLTITAVEGELPTDSHFVISYAGTGPVADIGTGTQHLTGTKPACSGDTGGSIGDIGGSISGSLVSFGLGSLSAN